ncbi:rRNA (cytosine-C5-)-methyltransferase nop2, partial [Kickxella alabastrina]
MGRISRNKQAGPLPLEKEMVTGKVTKALHDQLKHENTRSRKQKEAAQKQKKATTSGRTPAAAAKPAAAAAAAAAPAPAFKGRNGKRTIAAEKPSADTKNKRTKVAVVQKPESEEEEEDIVSDDAPDYTAEGAPEDGWDNAPLASASENEDDSMGEFDEDDDEEGVSQMPLSLLESDDEEDSDMGGIESYDEMDSDEDLDEEAAVTFRDMEKRSRKLDAMRKEDEEMADLEATVAEDVVEGEREIFMLPSAKQVEAEKEAPLDLSQVQLRIQEIIRVLNNFSELRAPDSSRNDYMEQLQRDMCFYYGYNEFLMDKLLQLFTVSEAVEFFEANE